MADFKPDNRPPLQPFLACAPSLGDGSGAGATGGVQAAAVADLDGWIATYIQPAIDAGCVDVAPVWIYGQRPPGSEYVSGMYSLSDTGHPFAPVGQAVSITPNTRRLHESEAVGTSFTSQITAAFDAIKPLIHQLFLSIGAAQASMDPTDNTELDFLLAHCTALDGAPILDAACIVDAANDMCVPEMHTGASWWSAAAEVFEAASDPAENGDPVAQWHDRSRNARDFSESTNKPDLVTGVVNGRPVIRFNGSSDRMALAADISSAGFDFEVVVKTDTTADMIWFSSVNAGKFKFTVRMNEIAGRIGANNGVDGEVRSGDAWASGSFHLLTVRCNGTTECRIDIDGTEVASYEVDPDFGAGPMEVGALGYFPLTGAHFLDGDIALLAHIPANIITNARNLSRRFMMTWVGLTPLPSATLPLKALVNRAIGTHGLNVIIEGRPSDINNPDLDFWYDNAWGVLGDATDTGADNIAYMVSVRARGLRAMVYFNTAVPLATRLALIGFWMSRGVSVLADFSDDMGAWTEAIAMANAALGGGRIGRTARMSRVLR